MQIILLDKVVHLGNVGDQVNVKAGYARNFLIPHGKAVMATKANIEHFETRRAELEEKAAKVQEQVAKQGFDLSGVTFSADGDVIDIICTLFFCFKYEG